MPSDTPSALASSLDFFAHRRKNGLAARGIHAPLRATRGPLMDFKYFIMEQDGYIYA